MKKIFISSLFSVALFMGVAQAQIQKGNVMVGGNLANINLGLDDPKIFSVDITPKAAWFIQDNLALGGYVNFGLETAKNSNTTTSYGVGALGRYYAGKDVEVLNHGRLFAEATVGIGGVNVSKGGGNTNGLNLSVGPGFAYFITPNIGLETLLKYNGLVGFGSSTTQSNLNLSFGFQIYLPGQRTANKVKGDIRN
ncbi:hypothetical protein EV200_101200 [Pedobacter psychrotolerans]|uniref:Outer membrane protein with beta-barrel domain n=1 Tax=Pedobacter psychrotolerans TaxID=1843235 RepID=A0A4R2HQ13_9SPHI|nr:hypothetical protein [Pedobacter psychrotolerans]TCO30761.1 hypothetical protein EV200_101200 [Pedobacter psychrotolerans]GGE44616.1 hypothetical protein GCM10011413_08440 [Pedobacter psychrotolerans]